MDDVARRINADINKLANELRGMRVTGAERAQVRALEDRLRTRWADLRAHRAGANAPGGTAPPLERRHTRW
jgi:hypothetical protein